MSRSTWLVFVTLLFVAGCGGGGSDSERTQVPETVREDPHPRPAGAAVMAGVSGRYGGRYVSVIRVQPKTFNGMMANESSSSDFTSGPLAESLLEYNYITQEYEPGLAESWEVNDAGTVWTFVFREGIRWSDGHPLTVDDFIFSMELVYDETLHPSVSDLCKINGEPFAVAKTGEFELTITTPEPYGGFLDAISSVRVMPKHRLEEAYRNGTFASAYGINTPPEELVVCGPWMLKKFVSQERVVLKPNPHYFRFDEAGRRLPYLDELVYLVVPDQNAQLLKFQAGECDEIYFRAEDYAALKDGEEQGGYTVYDLGQEMASNFFWFNLNTRNNPQTGEPFVDPVKAAWFQNREFRVAMSHAVDRQGIVDNVFYGIGEPLYGGVPAVNKKWHNPDIPKFTYDLDRSRELLTRAGYVDGDGDGIREDAEGNPLSFTLLVQPDNRERQGIANILADDFKKVGVEMKVAGVEFNTIITKLRETFDYDAILLGLTGGIPPSPYTGSNVYKSSGRTHLWNPEQPTPATPWEAENDRLMDVILTSVDYETARDAFFEIQANVAENQPVIYLVSRRGLLAVRDSFTGLQPSVMRPWVLWRSFAISYDPAGAREELAGE